MMHFAILKHLRLPTVKRICPTVDSDASELITLWGANAYARATDLSWQEDSGLVHTPRPGHWWRVRQEVARRTGHRVEDAVVEIAA